MSGYNEIAVTNRKLCASRDFLAQIEAIAAQQPWAILLREKDLDAVEYTALAAQVKTRCGDVPLIAHTHAIEGVERLHLPSAVLRQRERALPMHFSVSVHSVQEAQRAEELGAELLIAGHIFDTTCKPGLPARGVEFLRTVCENVQIPVFAIGGITEENMAQCNAAGAAGVCRMSYWMNI